MRPFALFDTILISNSYAGYGGKKKKMATGHDAKAANGGIQLTPFGVNSPRKLPMRVVVAGLGRTGTASELSSGVVSSDGIPD
jgi:hypothetical protein